MNESEKIHADETNVTDKSDTDQSTPLVPHKVSWEELKTMAGLPDIEDLSARIMKLEETAENIHREVTRHRLAKEVLSHLLAMLVVVGIERSGTNLKELIERSRLVNVEINEGSNGINFIMP